jgi:hypothetical protein
MSIAHLPPLVAETIRCERSSDRIRISLGRGFSRLLEWRHVRISAPTHCVWLPFSVCGCRYRGTTSSRWHIGWRPDMGNHRHLTAEAKMNDVDPLTWLALTLQRIANGWPISQIENSCRVTTRPERPQLRAYHKPAPRPGSCLANGPDHIAS